MAPAAPFSAPGDVTDEGLRCPHCRYNVTGLPEPRCPECGTAFDWEDTRPIPPQIAFERARGWHKFGGLLHTGLTVLFMPWIFARQVTRRGSPIHAFAFLILCYAGAALALALDPAWEVYAAWLIVALVYLLTQTVVLSLLDTTGIRHPLRAMRFWFVVGCYTSAVMATEILGPPLLTLSGLWHALRGDLSQVYITEMFYWSWICVVYWLQLSLWLLAIGCCFWARVRRAGRRPVVAAVWTAVALVAAVVLYSVCIEQAIYSAGRLGLV